MCKSVGGAVECSYRNYLQITKSVIEYYFVLMDHDRVHLLLNTIYETKCEGHASSIPKRTDDIICFCCELFRQQLTFDSTIATRQTCCIPNLKAFLHMVSFGVMFHRSFEKQKTDSV